MYTHIITSIIIIIIIILYIYIYMYTHISCTSPAPSPQAMPAEGPKMIVGFGGQDRRFESLGHNILWWFNCC